MGTAAAFGFSLWNMFGTELNVEGFYFETASMIITLTLLVQKIHGQEMELAQSVCLLSLTVKNYCPQSVPILRGRY